MLNQRILIYVKFWQADSIREFCAVLLLTIAKFNMHENTRQLGKLKQYTVQQTT